MSHKNYSFIASVFSVLFAGAAVAAFAQSPSASFEPIISGEFFSSRYNGNGVRTLDIRSAEEYGAGHIPGAVNSPYGSWRVVRDGIVGVLPSTQETQQLIQAAGIDKDTRVVVVFGNTDTSDFGAAARVYWTLLISGIKNISILDGGFSLWQQAGYPVDTAAVAVAASSFEVTKYNKRYISDLEEVQKLQGDKETLLVDARPKDQYEGYEKHPKAPYGGTIAGAKNYFQGLFLNADGTLKAKDELKAAADSLKDTTTKKIVTFCNTGHWAATDWFVFSQILGEPATLYDGSLVEWTAKNLQVENKKGRIALLFRKIFGGRGDKN